MSLAFCAPISGGDGFLKSSLVYLDCAGQAIGATGYTALAQPGSIISQLILAVITLFIAWYGIRLMFGQIPDMGDVVLAVAKIGVVLMLATSWPAVRTLFAEPSFAGPAELTAQTGIEGPMQLEDRLQRADNGIVALTRWGTGKLDIRAERTANGQPAATEFSGIALTDNLALGFGRLAFLVSTLLSLGLLRLLIGVMISALPLFAGLLLFESSRAIFSGWLRLIFALFVASFAIPLILTVELSMLEPWLTAAIAQRSAYYATPSAPTELLAISAAFLLILTGSMTLLVRCCFAVDVARLAIRIGTGRHTDPAISIVRNEATLPLATADRVSTPSRAEQLALTLNRVDRSSRDVRAQGGPRFGRTADKEETYFGMGREPASPSHHRAKQRIALSHARRNLL